MRWACCLLPAVLVLVLAACTRGVAASPVKTTAADPSLGSAVAENGLFSFQAPKGWTVQRKPELDYPTCANVAGTSSIEPAQQGYETVDKFTKAMTAGATGVEIVDNRSFTTHAGVTGERIVARKGGTQEVVIYAFAGKNGLLLTFTGACDAADDAKMRPLFDASLKSLVLMTASP